MSVFEASQISLTPFFGKGFCHVTYTTTHFTRCYSLLIPFSHDIIDILSNPKLNKKDYRLVARLIRTHPDVRVIKK